MNRIIARYATVLCCMVLLSAFVLTGCESVCVTPLENYGAGTLGTQDMSAVMGDESGGGNGSSFGQTVVRVSRVSVPDKMECFVGRDCGKALNAVVEPTNVMGVTLAYRSNNEAVATVDGVGFVVGVSAGECVITTVATSADGAEVAADTVVVVKENICNNCGRTGHPENGCPDKVVSDVKPEMCAVCNKPGHVASHCPKNEVAVVPVSCTYCGENGHNVDKCVKRAADEAPCTYCKKVGHKANNCPTKKADEAPCTYCKQAGHKVASCPKKAADAAKPKGCAYCGKSGHSATYCVKKATDNGAVGRWTIPDVGVNVAVYPGGSTAITDAKDSANYLSLGSQKVIGDHNYQGFDAIKKCKAGTVAYLETDRGKEKYICTKVMKGHNLGDDLTDMNGNSVAESNPGGITCYTCNENSYNVTIVFFAPEIVTKYTVLTKDNRAEAGFAGTDNEDFLVPKGFIGKDGVRYVITGIGSDAFAGCKKLKSVSIGADVAFVAEGAFEGCTSLASISVSSGNRNYASVDGVLYNKDKTSLLCYPAGKTADSFTIKAPTKTVGYRAFYGAVNLKAVTVEGTVQSVGCEAFKNCKALAKVVLGKGVRALEQGAFSGCVSLSSVRIPGGVGAIPAWAFADCASLESVVIENGVADIGSSAFQGCKSLSCVTIPQSVAKIGWGAFYGCDKMAIVNYDVTKAQWDAISISGGNASLINAFNVANH